VKPAHPATRIAIAASLAVAGCAFLILMSRLGVWPRLFVPIPLEHGGAFAFLFWSVIAACVIIWAGLFAILNLLPSYAKRRLVVVVTFLAGLYYILEFFLPAENRYLFFWDPEHANPFSPLISPLGDALTTIGGFTFFLAALSLFAIHGKNVVRLRPGWYNSVAFFVATILMAVFGLWKAYGNPNTTLWARITVDQVYDYLFADMFVPLNATIFSVLAFYIATAAYRAFRVRNVEAAFMMISAFLVMLGQVPLGQWLTRWLPETGPLSILRLEIICNWILGFISTAGFRAVLFGLLVGGLAMSLRLWLSLERGAFFEQRER